MSGNEQIKWKEILPSRHGKVLGDSVLFGDPLSGSCGALERYVARRQERLDEIFLDQNDKHSKRSHREYYETALCDIAQRLLSEINREKLRAEKHDYPFRCSDYHKSWAFALISYCRRHKKPLPTRVVELIFEAMDCKSRRPAAGLLQDLGLTSDIDNLEACMAASKLEGIADASAERWSERALAKEVGVSRPTINRWRKRDDYQQSRQLESELHKESLAIWSEINHNDPTE